MKKHIYTLTVFLVTLLWTSGCRSLEDDMQSQMRQNSQKKKSGSCKNSGSCSNPGNNKSGKGKQQSAKSMKDLQDALNKQMEAMKKQGKRTDLTLSQVATKLDSAAEIGAMTGESRDKVFRYIRLNNLLPELLQMVDEERIALTPALLLSIISLVLSAIA